MFQEGQSKTSARALSSEGRCVPKMVYSHGCWQDPSVSLHMDLSMELLGCSQNVAVSSQSNKGEAAATVFLMTQSEKSYISSATYYLLEIS